MANHLQSAVGKLDADETNALVAPLIAVLKTVAPDGDDGDAAREFCARDEAALAAHGHELAWTAPNGTTYEDVTVDVPDGEVEGFGPSPVTIPAWRRMAAASTNGRLRPGPAGIAGAPTVLTLQGTGATIFTFG